MSVVLDITTSETYWPYEHIEDHADPRYDHAVIPAGSRVTLTRSGFERYIGEMRIHSQPPEVWAIDVTRPADAAEVLAGHVNAYCTWPDDPNDSGDIGAIYALLGDLHPAALET